MIITYYLRSDLSAGTVPSSKNYLDGTVPSSKKLVDHTSKNGRVGAGGGTVS